MLVLKELLSSMTAATSVAAVPSASSGGSSRQGGVLGAWRNDITNFEGYMADGVPGIQREMHDTLWNIEHIYHRNAASSLLRGLILFGLAYLVLGSFFKYQMGARGVDMIPHVSFWMEYPNFVVDGMTYSKMLLGLQQMGSTSSGDLLSGGVSSRHGGGGSGAFETL